MRQDSARSRVVVFSLSTNRRFQHRIVLDRSTTDWIDVTFRTSRRRLRLYGPQPRFDDSAPLHLADDRERQELYRLRGRENRELDFTYPSLPYTLSESDLLPPLWQRLGRARTSDGEGARPREGRQGRGSWSQNARPQWQ